MCHCVCVCTYVCVCVCVCVRVCAGGGGWMFIGLYNYPLFHPTVSFDAPCVSVSVGLCILMKMEI